MHWILDPGGRNAINISKIANFREIHLVDISQSNLEKSKVNVDRYGKGKFDYFKTDGMHVELANKYKFIFSTITLQHIPSRTIRNSLLKDLINLLDDDGVISIQLGFGLKYTSKLKLMSVAYKNNDFASKVTNGRRDVRINSVKLILEYLKVLGAKKVEWFITPSFDDKHPKWLWLYIYKSDVNFLKTIQY
jgi:trans-aconitate methyltransferase